VEARLAAWMPDVEAVERKIDAISLPRSCQ